MKHILIAFFTLILVLKTSAQNVGINATGATPDASAMLDIISTTRGLLIPRVILTAANVAAPVTTPQTSLLVYNTNTASTGSTAVVPGYYYWDGAKWVALAGPNGRDWALLGNAGTTPPSVGYGSTVDNNFLGTTDGQDLTFVTNNIERMRIKNDNNTQLRIGMGTAFTANYSGGNPSLLHLNDWGNTSSDYAQLALSSANNTNGDRMGVINFAAAGASAAATIDRKTASIESFLTTVPTTTLSGDLRFFTNNTGTFAERMRIISNGNVGIGTTAPTQVLDVYNKLQVNTAGDLVKIKDVSYSWPSTQGGANTVLLNDGSGNLSWSAPYGGNIQFAEGTTDISTTSVTYVDMAGMSITFTPKHTTVYIQVSASGDIDVGAAGRQMGYVKCRVTNSAGTTVYGKVVSIGTDADDVSGENGAWNCSIVCRATGLTIGASTTLKVQWAHGGSSPGTARCSASTTDYSQRTMMIID